MTVRGRGGDAAANPCTAMLCQSVTASACTVAVQLNHPQTTKPISQWGFIIVPPSVAAAVSHDPEHDGHSETITHDAQSGRPGVSPVVHTLRRGGIIAWLAQREVGIFFSRSRYL